jgi:hypothetical protein
MSLDMTWLTTLHLLAAAMMAGVLWVVQLAVYPLFDGVGAGFGPYHRRYTAGMGLVVGPLMVLELATAAALWALGLRGAVFGASLLLLAGVWVITFAVQVPLHRRLAGGYDPAAHRRLVRSNWVRTIAWTARAGLVAAL